MLQQLMQKLRLDVVPPQILVAVLAFVAVMFIGVGFLAVVERRRKRTYGRLEVTPSAELSVAPLKESRFLQLMERVGNYVSHGQGNTSLWEQLIRAGYMGRAAPAVYTGVKMLLLLVGLAVMAILVIPLESSVQQKAFLVLAGGSALFFIPNLIVRVQEKNRRQEIRQALPDAVDLLEVCVSSGIGLDMAWNMVAEEIHHVSPVLGNAMDLSNFEMHLGASRTEAMRNMATRTGAQQLASLAAILVQSERFGTSVATALQEFASWMREERQMNAEEEAEKLPTKLLFPMALFIFPSIMVVTLGPAAIQIWRTLVSM
jgi:tight adherence protein C